MAARGRKWKKKEKEEKKNECVGEGNVRWAKLGKGRRIKRSLIMEQERKKERGTELKGRKEKSRTTKRGETTAVWQKRKRGERNEKKQGVKRYRKVQKGKRYVRWKEKSEKRFRCAEKLSGPKAVEKKNGPQQAVHKKRRKKG